MNHLSKDKITYHELSVDGMFTIVPVGYIDRGAMESLQLDLIMNKAKSIIYITVRSFLGK